LSFILTYISEYADGMCLVYH